MNDERRSIPPVTLPREIEERLARFDGVARVGRVIAVTGTVIRAELPEGRIGEICRVKRPGQADLDVEVVGFDREGVILMALGSLDGVEAGAAVTPAGRVLLTPCGPEVRGRVLDALGRPIDSKGSLGIEERGPLAAPPPPALTRARIREPLATGVRALDACLTIGRGQRVGIFAPPGVGKSSLLSMIARNVQADLIVLALVGERGREVAGFIEDDLSEGLERAAVVVSTSDQPALLRLRAAHTALAIAEAARSRGEHVVLLMDSVTRFARALREVGLAAGEPPGRQGFPASVFAELPRMFERAGTAESGSITGFYTVLTPADDFEDPVAEETMGLLDGHVILSRELASRGLYPAIDVVRSKSRVMREIVSPEHQAAASKAVRLVAAYRRNYDKISCNAYEKGSDPVVDEAIARIGAIESFLAQSRHDVSPFEASAAGLRHATGT